MDLQIGIFCLVIASVSSLIIYIILSISSIKEDSFEEAKANRRKIIKQYHDQSKTGVEKSKDKKLKKTTKKSKKNEADEEVPTSKENEAEGIDEKEVKKVPLKPAEEIKAMHDNKKVAKSEKSKKPVPTEVAGPSTAGNPTTIANKPITKQASEKSLTSKASKKKNEEVSVRNRGEDDGDHKSSTTSLLSNEEPSKEVVTPQQQQETVVKHAAKPSKKKRSEITTLHQLSNEREAVNINLLVSLVQKAELSRTEIQLLIDALLNKQQEDISEWLKGRQDPQVKLRKQLTEFEQALKDEKQISAGFQAKLKELRNEINADKASARHNEELIVTMQNDCKTLSVKLQQTIEENQVLASKIQQYQKQLADEQLTVRKLKDEQGIQQQITEKQCHEAVISLQGQVNQYAAQSQELQAANNSLRAEIAMLQENDLRIQEEYREVNANLERALSAATFDANTVRNELTNVEHALSEARVELESLSGALNAAKLDNQHYIEQNKQFLDQCSSLTKENESLKEKVSENLENGYSSIKQDIADYEARLKESDDLLNSLKNEIETKNKTIEELNSVVSLTKNECQKTKSSLDTATKEITLLKHKASSEPPKSENDDSITQLKNLLNDKNRELANLKSELETSKSRNNESPDSNCDVKVRTWIQRIIKHLHPELTLEDTKGIPVEEWLQKVEEAVTNMNHSSVAASEQNSQLQSLVQHYKTIINETEGMLNQLQSHVEVEESRWKEKLRTLEEELDLLRQQNMSK
uniref:Kinectin n=2 Tax=Lygus hesperus TaxID=30085 RepID=A0A0A9WBH4_LYGHE